MMRFCPVLLSLLLLAMSARSSEVPLKVMSWNCHKGSTAWDAADQTTEPKAEAQKMFESGCDVIGLQEVRAPHRLTFKSELERLSGTTWYMVAGFSDGADLNSTLTIGNIILSKLPVESDGLPAKQDIGPGDNGKRVSALRAKVVVNGMAVNIFNAHLDYYSETSRTENLKNLMAWSASSSFAGPKIVLGDFNANWNSTWIATMKTAYADTWEDFSGSPSSAPPSHQAGWRPDYVFRSKEAAASMHVTYAQVWTLTFENSGGLSDHRPVIAHIGIVNNTTAGEAPPVPWQQATVASGGNAGGSSSSYANGAFTLNGNSHGGVYETNDAIRFVYVPLTGDGSITVRVNSLSTSGTQAGNAVAGVMFRESLNAGSRDVCYTLLKPIAAGVAPTLKLRSRAMANGASGIAAGTSGISLPTAAFPCWIRLERKGNVFTASYCRASAEGTYVQHCQYTLALSSQVFVGIFAGQENTSSGSTGVASIDNVSVSGWRHANVGTPAGSSSGAGNSGSFTLSSNSHGGVYEETDGCRFVYKTFSGDGSIVVRVNSLNTSATIAANAVAGVMFRESLNADSRQVCYTLLQPTSSVAPYLKLRSRTSVPGTTSPVSGSVKALLAAPYYPCWMKLVRSGNTFTASYSMDGTNFTQHASTTLALASTLYVGMFAGQENMASGSTANAVFGSVTLSGAGGEVAASRSLNPAATPVITSSATAFPSSVSAGDAVSFSVGASGAAEYVWDFGDGASAGGASVAHAYAAAGTYRATVVIRNGAGVSVSAQAGVTVQAASGGEDF